MWKLYCLSHRFRVRWSYSKQFYCFSDVVKFLKSVSLEPLYWTDGFKYYKLVSPGGNIQYYMISINTFGEENYIFESTLKTICEFTNLYESLLK